MSTQSENLKAFKNGISLFKNKLNNVMPIYLAELAFRLIQNAIKSKTWTGFTGNAQTSFAVGVYVDGKVVNIVDGTDYENREAIMKKIRYGQRVFLKHPFEGNSRAVIGKVEVTDEKATETSRRFIRNKRPTSKGYSIIVTIGAEYYAFIDNNLFAMRNTYDITDSLLNEVVWKRITI